MSDRGPHRHVNQLRLNGIGSAPANPFTLDGAGEAADERRWNAVSGPLNGDGSQIAPDDPDAPWSGIRVLPARVSEKGKFFARELLYDAGGALYAASAERLVGSASGSMFESSGSGYQPKTATIGESDLFYRATADGLEARTDFEEGDETQHLRETDSGERVELKETE